MTDQKESKTCQSNAELYKSCMLLSAVGDALGYKNQEWEYCKSGPEIHSQLAALGGVNNILVTLPDWRVSDDTVMHLATAEGLLMPAESKEVMFTNIARKYKECMNDMEGRKPGPTSMKGCDELKPEEAGGYRIPFNPTGTGCGAAMRAMCIGLRYPRPSEVSILVEVAVECGRMTHHHPTGYLGSLAAALFVSFAVQKKPPRSWARALLDTLPLARQHVEGVGVAVDENLGEWDYFTEKWTWYSELRGVTDGTSEPVFPAEYGVQERDEVYETFSLPSVKKGWAGRSGHDAPMIALDALMGAGDDWVELCNRAMFHAGDNDSTGVIAGACYGALYGLENVPACNYQELEYRSRLEQCAKELHELAFNCQK